MDNNNLLYILIIIATSFAIQAGIMVALFLAVRKSSARMETLAIELKSKAIPTIEAANAFLTELRPKVDVIVENVTNTTGMVRSQIQRLDATVSDVVDRTRLQVIRADELLSRTTHKVQLTTDVTTPPAAGVQVHSTWSSIGRPHSAGSSTSTRVRSSHTSHVAAGCTITSGRLTGCTSRHSRR